MLTLILSIALGVVGVQLTLGSYAADLLQKREAEDLSSTRGETAAQRAAEETYERR
jgi:hypothetical protein